MMSVQQILRQNVTCNVGNYSVGTYFDRNEHCQLPLQSTPRSFLVDVSIRKLIIKDTVYVSFTPVEVPSTLYF